MHTSNKEGLITQVKQAIQNIKISFEFLTEDVLPDNRFNLRNIKKTIDSKVNFDKQYKNKIESELCMKDFKAIVSDHFRSNKHMKTRSSVQDGECNIIK